MSNEKIAVLVMSYGTPKSMEDIKQYYTHIRRGQPPTAEQLNELTKRYEAIVGGVFPLRHNTDAQVSSLQNKLNQLAPYQYVCYQGLKHAEPYIEDGVEQIAKSGITQAVGIVLAPHYSMMSIGGYIKRAKEKAAEHGISISFVESYHMHPKLIEALTNRVQAQLDKLKQLSVDKPVKVLFSAHSLPERILAMGDPYPNQLMESSAAIAESAEVEDWQFTWQSAGRTHEPWLGPDILDTMEKLAAQGYKAILSAPIGFVSNHLEVLYDLDIEAKTKAKELGVAFERIEMLNADPLYIEALAECVLEASRS